MVREFVAKVLWGSVEAREGAVVRWSSSEMHIRAEVVVARQAWGAASARISGLQSNAVAGLESLDLGSHFNNCPGGFVAQDHGAFQDKGANPPLTPVVHIATADTGIVDGKEDIVWRFNLRLKPFLKTNPVGFVKNE